MGEIKSAQLTGPDMTKLYEGYVPTFYNDTVGKRTIGYGFNVTEPSIAKQIPVDVLTGKRPLYKNEADQIFMNIYQDAINTAANFVGGETFSQLDPQKQNILVDLAYNLGPNKLAQFKNFKSAVVEGNYPKAAQELKNSKWFKQVGRRGRAHVAGFGGSNAI